MLDRPGILIALSLLPAIIALVGLGVSPAVETSWDGEMTFLIHAWFGLPAIVAGCRYGAQRRVHPWIRRIIPIGAIAAGVAGVGLSIGVDFGILAASGAAPGVLVVAVFLGLALAEGGAVVAMLAGTSIRGRVGQVLRTVGIVGAASTAVLMMLTTMEPLTEPFSVPFRGTGEWLATVAIPTVWVVVAAVTLDRLQKMPEFAGVVERPRVPFTCPRCGMRQLQAGASGCRRCGLDVRVEVL